MAPNPDIFSLPGFVPLTAPHQENQLEALVDGSIDVVFYKDRPIGERTPLFSIIIGKEFGNQVTVYRDFDNHFVTAVRDPEAGLKHYRFLAEAQHTQILPGNYVIRFFADETQVAIRYLAVRNSVALGRSLPPNFQA